MTSSIPMAAVFGCAGPELQAEEAAFFRDANPLGFILFARNCKSPKQIRRLTSALRITVGRADAPILMDHEGGRVQRLPSPPWRKVAAPAQFGSLPENLAAAAVTINAKLMAFELLELGINVNCVPCLDVNDPKGHKVIGDRAYSANPTVVAKLGRAAADGLLAGGVLPIIKHIPGHGRATVDSHSELPIVKACGEELADRDFRPFEDLADLPLGMTAHVLFSSLDPEVPGTLSEKIISQVIRQQIGFNGLLFTDDLSMKALGGAISNRMNRALKAGCDVALHCNGQAEEMHSIAENCPPLSKQAQLRWGTALKFRQEPQAQSRDALLAELEGII